MRVSDPEGDSYGEFWSPQKVAEFFAPSQESHQQVMNWLMSEDTIDPNQITVDRVRGWIHVDTTVKQAELILDTTYYHYSNGQGQIHIGCEYYSLPDDVAHHVDMVAPTVHLPLESKKLNRRSEKVVPVSVGRSTLAVPHHVAHRTLSSTSNALSNCDTFITPDCLRHMYNFADYRSVATQQNSMALVAFTTQPLIFKGVEHLLQFTCPACIPTKTRVYPMGRAEGSSPLLDDEELYEVEIDVEYTLPLVYPLQPDIYQVRGHSREYVDPFEPLLQALDPSYSRSANTKYQSITPAKVISISYGMSEISSHESALIRQCDEYGKLGLMGTTVLVATGDFGVAGHAGQCAELSQRMLTNNGIRFAPNFPASCPYVTAVGGTSLPFGSTWKDQEKALEVMGMRSGGGFSDVFGMPEYQRTTIEAYFKNHKPPYSADRYNNSMKARAFPDISLNGGHYLASHYNAMTKSSKFFPAHGTSLSAPVMASMIALVNDARLAMGKKTVGFINPSLYSPRFASAFNDIVSGNSSGCQTAGFQAVKGWDPVTGFGTVNFGKLLELWTSV